MPHWVDPVPALKRRVADEILTLTNGWSQMWAASFMGISQSQVSALRNDHLERLSLDQLVRCASRLNRDVAIVTKRAAGPSVHPHWEIDGPSARFPSPNRGRG